MGDEGNEQGHDEPRDGTASQPAAQQRAQQRSPAPYERLNFNDIEMTDLYVRDLVQPWHPDDDWDH